MPMMIINRETLAQMSFDELTDVMDDLDENSDEEWALLDAELLRRMLSEPMGDAAHEDRRRWAMVAVIRTWVKDDQPIVPPTVPELAPLITTAREWLTIERRSQAN